MSNEFIYGLHAVTTILSRDPERIIEAYVSKDKQDSKTIEITAQLKSFGITVQGVNKKTLDDKSTGGNHQGILLKVKPAPMLNEHDLDNILDSTDSPLLLILDGVTDPHNLGACLRNADAAGVCAVIVPKDRSASLNATVSKVACGAAEVVPLIRVTNLARTMRTLQERNVWILGTAGEATNDIYQAKLTGAIALVMGAEGEGMRRLTREHCDDLIKIPMAGSVSSLNVSVASGVCLFEAVRQRSVK